METITCLHCGKKAQMRRNARFCSPSCRVKHCRTKAHINSKNESEEIGLLRQDLEYLAAKVALYEPDLDGCRNIVAARYLTSFDLAQNARRYINGELPTKPSTGEIEYYKRLKK